MAHQLSYLDFQTPEDFDSKYSKIINNTSDKIEKILKGLTPKTKSKSKKSEEYSQYLVMEIMNRAMTNLKNPIKNNDCFLVSNSCTCKKKIHSKF